MSTNLERASLVSRSVQIESVILIQVSMDANLDPHQPPQELRLGQQFRCRYETREAQRDRLFVYVSLLFDASATSLEPSENRVVDLSATFLATYRIDGAASFPEDALQHFADLNGTLQRLALLARAGAYIHGPGRTERHRRARVQAVGATRAHPGGTHAGATR